VGKGENAGNQRFLLFLKCFLAFPKKKIDFSVTFILLSANAFSLEQSKILLFCYAIITHDGNLQSSSVGCFSNNFSKSWLTLLKALSYFNPFPNTPF
jgi:hypothetical protein